MTAPRITKWIAVGSLALASFAVPALAQSAATSNNDGVNMTAPAATPAPAPTTPDIPRNTSATTPDMDKGTGGSGLDPSTTPSKDTPSTDDHNPVHEPPQSATR